jgi:3-amino-5-hydroxybenzoic acid synthesis related protein
MTVRAVLFDLDGTLIDSHALIVASFQHACREVLGREITEQEARVRWGEPLAIRFAALAPDDVGPLLRAYAAFYDEHEPRMASVFPGVAAMLAGLAARGCVSAVVTSKRARAASQAIQVLGLTPWIATAVGAEDAPRPKPAPDPVRLALQRLDAAPAAAVMIGDAPLDIAAAQAAGVRSVAALWGVQDCSALLASRPDYVAPSPADVVEIVASG